MEVENETREGKAKKKAKATAKAEIKSTTLYDFYLKIPKLI